MRNVFILLTIIVSVIGFKTNAQKNEAGLRSAPVFLI